MNVNRNFTQYEDKDNKSSRRKQGKRTLANFNACKTELKKELHLLFKTYFEAIDKANKALSGFPPHCRSRNLEASVIQSSFAEVLLQNFNDEAFFGKYKRLILRVDGYLILFKKLDKKGYPMNIQTSSVQSILNQNQVLDLFSDSNYGEDPILYFGYQKNKIGGYVNPQLIYIDEGKVQFSITESDIEFEMPQNEETNQNTEVQPKLKENQVNKKAI